MCGLLTRCVALHRGFARWRWALSGLVALALAALVLGAPGEVQAGASDTAVEATQPVAGSLAPAVIAPPELTAADYPSITGVNSRVTV
ncbi:MAG: hypothetical protein V1245_09380, partial [Arenicellales bacterium]|nr:hypothetical protein [Arenicellales bacterium]